MEALVAHSCRITNIRTPKPFGCWGAYPYFRPTPPKHGKAAVLLNHPRPAGIFSAFAPVAARHRTCAAPRSFGAQRIDKPRVFGVQ